MTWSLVEAHALLAAIVESSEDAIISKSLDGTILSWNAGAEQLFGYAPGEAIGRPVTLIIPPELQEEEQAILERLRRGERVQHFETARVAKDGRHVDVSLTISPIRDAEGCVVGASKVARDISGRKRAEETLRDRERLLGIVTSSARVGLVVVNDRYEYLFANHAYAGLFGLDPGGVVGSRVPDLLAAGWAQIQPRLDRALAGERVTYELTLPSQKGGVEPQWFRVTYEPRVGEVGAATVVVVVVDITEHKKAESVFRASEERYRFLFERNLAAVVLTRGDGAVLGANAAAARLFGVASPDALRVRRMQDFYFDPGERAALAEAVAQDRSLTTREVRFRRADGRELWTLANVTLLEDGPEGPIFQSTLFDITDRKRSEEELRLRDRAIQAVSQGILITDPNQPDNPIVYVNPSFEKLTGYAASEVVGRNCRFLQGQQTDPDAVALVRAAVREGKACEVELRNYRKDGTLFWNQLSIAPVRDEQGRLAHFIGVQTDVTEQRKLEEQLRQAQKMKAVGQLAGGVAHDFNNLLQVINGFGDLVQSELPEGSRARELVGEMTKAGERAAGLTRQLLAFSRQQVVATRVLDLNDVVRDVEKMLHRIIGEDIALAASLQPDPAFIKADPGQLEQVLLNLAINARDAMPQGGKLTIETKEVELDHAYAQARTEVRPGRYVLLAMSDTGIGMPAEIQARIFEPFFTTKEQGKGTGLGLATVFGIVKQFGGHVAVYSEPGHGTTFKVYLPQVAEAAQPRPVSAGPVVRPRGQETLLLVEDDDAVRALTRHVLKNSGYHLLEAAGGRDALRLAEGHRGPIHLLVSDVVMPGLGGRELAEKLLLLHPETKVLYLSGYTDDAVVRHGVLEAEVNFLQKPFRPAELARKVREVLEGRAEK